MSQECEKPVIWLHRGVCDPLGMEGRGGADPMPLLWTKKKLCGHVDGSKGTIKGSGGIPWGVKIKQEEEEALILFFCLVKTSVYCFGYGVLDCFPCLFVCMSSIASLCPR